MSRSTNTLNRARNAFWRRHHHDQVDRANINSELETGRTDDGPKFAIFQAIFYGEPNATIKRSMMNLDRVRQLRKVFAQSQSNLFRSRADIGENDDRLARTDQLRQ